MSGKAVGLSNLVARAGDRSVTLHWSGKMASSIEVERAIDDGDFRKLANERTLRQSFADTEVENGHRYTYRVRAKGEERGYLQVSAEPMAFKSDESFLEYLQATAFDYFWNEVSTETGLIRDRNEPESPCSIAAVGFGLTAIGIGIDHGWIHRAAGRKRVLQVLRTLEAGAEGSGKNGMMCYKGWFYHFLEMGSGTRYRNCEISSIDTALLMAGVLYSAEYFDAAELEEDEIRTLARKLFERIDWRWMLNGETTLSMGWTPEHGFIPARWEGYNEASILYLLGIGTEGSGLTRTNWEAWTRTYEWKKSYGYEFIHFPPLFGHQYSACWIDFRGMSDEYLSGKGITYFENSRRATLAQRAYAMANPGGHKGYGPNLWGFTACDGPGRGGYTGYGARGAPPPENDDGTIAPTAAGGSLPFTPKESMAVLRSMYERFRPEIWCGYGFRDAFNLEANWWDPDVLGIDQGPILIMAENLRSGKVWKRMRKNKVVAQGLERVGFQPMREEDGSCAGTNLP
jgi:hypothetical protein